MTQFTVTISDEAARQIYKLAALDGREVEEYASEIVEQGILDDSLQAEALLASLSDEDVLALADLRLTEEENRRLSELLELNREEQLSSGQQLALEAIMRQYDEGMLKKAMGWAEAVRRKLRQPICS